MDNIPTISDGLEKASFQQVSGGLLGVATAAIMNLTQGKPAFARLPRFPIFALIGYGLGTFSIYHASERILRREVYLYDYMRRHPEDFPPEERRTWGETFLPWTPIR